MTRTIALSLVLLAAAGCTGIVDGDPTRNGNRPPGSSGPGGVDPLAGVDPLRRLTRVQYERTLTDLFGTNLFSAASLPDDHVTVSAAHAQAYLFAAETISERATADLGSLLPCDPRAAGDETCAHAFIDDFGRRAYRRPLEAAEREALRTAYANGSSFGGFREGIRFVLEHALQAPQFLYRLEGGPEDGRTAIALTDWEIASRLSYLLWNTMPDDALFRAAEQGALRTPAEIAAHADRMLASERVRETVRLFHDAWLELDRIDRLIKDPNAFPEFGAAWSGSAREAVHRFLDSIVWEGTGDMRRMYTATHAYVNETLAPVYGLSNVTGSELVRVELDPTERLSLLTQAGILAKTAKASETSPVRRGLFVREHLLCQKLPTPPPDVETLLPSPRPDATTRERFSEHASNDGCAVCHKLIDPLGFGLENYDALGYFRATENGVTIDASGELVEAAGGGTFDGAVALSRMLAESPETQACLVEQWFRHTYGRGPVAADRPNLAALGTAFDQAGRRVPDLLRAIVTSEAFRTRQMGANR